MKVVQVLVGLLAILALAAPVSAAPRPTEYILPGDDVFPEGIAYREGTDNFYVSSTTDGTIFLGDLEKPVTDVFLPGGEDGRTTAVGLAFGARRLFIAGGNTGKVFVYDTKTKELLFTADNDLDATFVNDVAVDERGPAFFTDSVSPYLYRVYRTDSGDYAFERFIDFTGTALRYIPGFNANGIEITRDGKYLIIVQSNTGKLFRVEIATKTVTEIDLGGEIVSSGDGLVLRGRTLYVVRNALGQIDEVRLSGDLLSGTVVGSTTDSSFAFPTTAAFARGRLLVVNAQFNARGNPDLPFTVSSIKAP